MVSSRFDVIFVIKARARLANRLAKDFFQFRQMSIYLHVLLFIVLGTRFKGYFDFSLNALYVVFSVITLV